MDHFLTGGYLLGRQHVGGAVHGDALAVGRLDEDGHPGTVVPHGSQLVAVLPLHLDRPGRRVSPGRVVVGNAQQVGMTDGYIHCCRCCIVAHAPHLLGRSTHHHIFHRHAALLQHVLRQYADKRRVLIGVVGLCIVQGHRSDGLQVLVAARQRAHHHKLVALYHILVAGGVDIPFQLHGTGIGEHLVGGEAQHAGLEVEGTVHRGVVLVVEGHVELSHLQFHRQPHVLMLLGGRQVDEAGVGILWIRNSVDGLSGTALVGIGTFYPQQRLVAREGHFHLALLALVHAGRDVVGLEGHVVARRPRLQYGHCLAVGHLPRTFFLAVHQVHHLRLVGLVVVIGVGPTIAGHAQRTRSIAAPTIPTLCV